MDPISLEFKIHQATKHLLSNLAFCAPELYGEKCTEFNGEVVEILRDFLTVEALKIKAERERDKRAQGN